MCSQCAVNVHTMCVQCASNVRLMYGFVGGAAFAEPEKGFVRSNCGVPPQPGLQVVALRPRRNLCACCARCPPPFARSHYLPQTREARLRDAHHPCRTSHHGSLISSSNDLQASSNAAFLGSATQLSLLCGGLCGVRAGEGEGEGEGCCLCLFTSSPSKKPSRKIRVSSRAERKFLTRTQSRSLRPWQHGALAFGGVAGRRGFGNVRGRPQNFAQ